MTLPLIPVRTDPPGVAAEPAWPHRSLDVRALRAGGWRPRPFRDFVIKAHQRCNLACDYCYMYTMADQSWRSRPATMPPEVAQAAAERIGAHVRAHDLDRVRFILHGGEPLMAGRDGLRSIVGTLRAALPETCVGDVGLQTNGVLLDEPMLDELQSLGVTIGVSLDGPAVANDQHRRTAGGRGSFAAVDRALTLLNRPERRGAYAGLLCTVDPRTDPVACYETLLGYAPPAIDLLFPHANWAEPPWRPAPGATPYADWLVAIFDRWYDAVRQETRIRLFESIINLLLGGGSRSEQVGLSPVAVAVIETDGAVEQEDSLKSAYEGACATGANVLTDDLDTVLRHPGVAARQIGRDALADVCRSCPLHRVCGAGHYAHRYRPADGFRNPSVYCADLSRLITHVHDRVSADLARSNG
ncbi:FxsB family cyclophane-forming radical SAM/SPASM peptide maturase [Actinoplanes oblitus]|uniref:FxsB family cyclophane-forming radical SAM/SPASM peptide maturase n=1 Tax=Actinoplanes oblitus TaxID=3040509 RepID=A0ABY8WGT0_9ACTN|nr:FxsB family cyclophane-forming radical SAM/SPASM peptide maturase [Actinoplanes oblitus]WIM97030.1 FxsB family cyclophane-forming radical SAM/SPASM peptide maturase [Actinoplanes oblitus]